MNYRNSFTGLDQYTHLDGTGIGVAVLDSGVYQAHPDLKHHFDDGSIRSFDFTESTIGFEDKRGHGTHVSGLIGASQVNENGITGIAPNCKIWNIKVLSDDSGSASNEALEAAVNKILSTEECRVVNMSFNLNYDQQAFMNPLMERLAQSNKIVVAAAGDNSILKQYTAYPAYLDTTLSVGAINSNFELSADQKIDDKVDFLLPNENLISCGSDSNLYVEKHGSSMATALISGIVTLMLQNEPSLRLLELKQRLSNLSVPYQNNANRPLLQLIKPDQPNSL